MSDYALLAEYFTREGCPTEIVSPDQLEYRNGVLRHGEFTIDIVYRRIKLQEFLVRFDLSHPAGARLQGSRRLHGEQLPRPSWARRKPCSIC